MPAVLVPAALVPAVLVLAPAATAQERAVDFVADVAPILQQRCVGCHGPAKQKGDLRLDRREHLFHGERDLWTVVPGDPGASVLIERVELPAGDDDIMPNEGEPLRPEQIDVLRRWIAAGAGWPAAGDDYFAAAEAAARVPRIDFGIAAPDEAAAARIEAAQKALEELGAVALRVAADTPAVDVNASLLGGRFGDGQVPLLRDLAPVLVWLNLAGTAVTDAGLAELAGFAQLRRLNLSRTAIGDAGLAHLRGLARLEVLNLYGSKVTDAGLAHLREAPALRKIYAFETMVTAGGAAAWVAGRPGVAVDRGEYVTGRLAAAEAQIAGREEHNRPANATCPVTGEPVDPATALDHEGLRIAFCCNKCRTAFEREPAKFADRVAEYRRAAAEEAGRGPEDGGKKERPGKGQGGGTGKTAEPGGNGGG